MNYTKRTLITTLWVTLLSCLISIAHANSKEIVIGLRAHTGIENSRKQWQATADYLSKHLGDKFIIKPYPKLDALMQATGEIKFDFVITNPSSYVEMNIRYGAQSLIILDVGLPDGTGYNYRYCSPI